MNTLCTLMHSRYDTMREAATSNTRRRRFSAADATSPEYPSWDKPLLGDKLLSSRHIKKRFP